MKITDVQVDCFGHWKDLKLPDVSPGVTVIHGPNEAGKSTLLHLIRAILYGFDIRQHSRFVPPRYSGSIGGQLQVQASTGRFAVRRWLADSHAFQSDDAGDLSVRAIDSPLQGKHLLPTLLNGVDDAIFRNVFAVGLSEMQQLATLSDTDAAHQLYGLAAGTDRVSVAEVSRQLETSRCHLLNGDHETSIGALLLRRHELLKEIDHEQQQSQHWLKLFDERRKVSDEISKLEHRRKRYGDNLATADRRTSLRNDWKSCRRLHRRLKALGPVSKVPSEAVRRLDRLSRQIGTQRKDWEKLRHKRRQWRERSRKLAGHPVLIHYAESIQSLQNRSGWIADLVVRVERSKTHVEETEFELQGELEQLGLKPSRRLEALPLITDTMVADLRQLAGDTHQSRQRSEAAEQAGRESERTAEKLQRQLESRLPSGSTSELAELMKGEEGLIGLLRHRIQLQGELDAANRGLAESREEHYRWAKRRLLPWRGLMSLGSLFSLGMVLFLTAVFAHFFRIEGDQRWTFGFVGAAVCGSAILIKAMFEMAAGRSASRCRSEIESSQRQIERLADDMHQVDSQLPSGHEPFAVQLRIVEERWQELSELQPLEQQRLEALGRRDASRDEADLATHQQQDSQQRWQGRLRHYELPESMSFSQFDQLSQSDSKLGQRRHKLNEAHHVYAQQQEDLKEIRDQLQMLFERVGEAPESDRLDEQIEQVFRLLQAARENHQQREALHRKWHEAGRQQQEVARTAQRLLKRRRQLVAKYGVLDPQELKATVKRRNQSVTLKRERDQLLRQLAKRLSSVWTLAQLTKELEDGDFESRLRKWEDDHDQTEARLSTLLERRGELGQQIKDLTSHRRVSKQRLQLSEVQAQLDRNLQQWETLAGVSSVLAEVRTTYESDRQPETLAEASSYLKKMTGDRYSRIWTPLGESRLCVDDRDGKGIRVEEMSRGTREQVFLSLRLALAAVYSRRGAALPLVLDDVFVNFDAHRARDAAETVCQFAAAGHQVLVFTCHDHIRDVFWRMGVDLRVLPDAEQNARSPQPVLTCQQVASDAQPLTAANDRVNDGLPLEGDPDLDHELLYGAPEYDPGYEAPNEKPLAPAA